MGAYCSHGTDAQKEKNIAQEQEKKQSSSCVIAHSQTSTYSKYLRGRKKIPRFLIFPVLYTNSGHLWSLRHCRTYPPYPRLIHTICQRPLADAHIAPPHSVPIKWIQSLLSSDIFSYFVIMASRPQGSLPLGGHWTAFLVHLHAVDYMDYGSEVLTLQIKSMPLVSGTDDSAIPLDCLCFPATMKLLMEFVGALSCHDAYFQKLVVYSESMRRSQGLACVWGTIQ